MQYTRVYSQQRELLGFLENATYQYTLKDAPLHQAKITLSTDDTANSICQMHNLVEIFDGNRRVELFRIVGAPEATYTRNGGKITYKCEHVLATLIDEVMFGYHEIGGSAFGVDPAAANTSACIRYVLGFQHTPHWVLGRCDFARLFQYSWENETVLRALLSIPNRLENEYIFTYDTTAYPWVVNLVELGNETDSELRYSRNLHEIQKTVDAEQLVTRLYALGYGEGVNQLTIRDVNNGVPYLDADTIGVWGVKSSIWTDRRFEIAQSLKERAQAILDELKNPYISYKVKAADLYELTGEPFDNFLPGKLVRVIDHEHDIQFAARVTEITKADVRGKPGEITVTIANKAKTVADTLSELASRASINELYAQGATTLHTIAYADNADKDHPAVLSTYIPPECARINQMILRWRLEPFRSYSRGAAAGGASHITSSAGGGSSVTSSEGGGQLKTSATNGGFTVTSGASSIKTTNQTSVISSGSSIPTTSPSSAYTGSASGDTGSSSGNTGGVSVKTSVANGEGAHAHDMPHSHSLGGHTHSLNSHTHNLGAHTHYNEHVHTIEHSHGMDHTHQVSASSHSHQVAIDAHTHTVHIDHHTHSLDVQPHTHQLEPGIYNGPIAGGIALVIDGNPVPSGEIQGYELDIVRYLQTGDDGKILRGAWHEVVIMPVADDGNSDGLTRIAAQIMVQTFVRSQGGGDY